MAISNYVCDGKQYFRVYIQAVGKRDKSLRVQRSKFKVETIGEARKIEKALIKSVTEEIGKFEGRGLTACGSVDPQIIRNIGQLIGNNRTLPRPLTREYSTKEFDWEEAAGLGAGR